MYRLLVSSTRTTVTWHTLARLFGSMMQSLLDINLSLGWMRWIPCLMKHLLRCLYWLLSLSDVCAAHGLLNGMLYQDVLWDDELLHGIHVLVDLHQ